MDLPIEKRKEIYLEKARECTSFLEKKYKVKRVYVIGSLVKGKFHDRSDIDLVVEGLTPRLYIDALTGLYDLLLPGKAGILKSGLSWKLRRKDFKYQHRGDHQFYSFDFYAAFFSFCQYITP
jgi:hypothetical protein